MDKLIRCITDDGAVSVTASETSDIAFTAQRLHKTSPSATAALGRLLTAASLMGAQLKSSDGSLTLRINGNGPLGSVIAVGDSKGNCRGYCMNPGCKTEYYENGKINVSAAVGKDGILTVMKDLGEGEPYIGQIELASGEIAEDITSYYARSEQLPTVCSLGVLLDKEKHEVMLSGGFLIQLLPMADDSVIDRLEANIQKLEPMTAMLARGMSVLDICKKALEGFRLEVLEEHEINYVCSCSRERVESSLSTLKDEEILSLPDERGFMEAACQFCGKKYSFSRKDLEELVKRRNSKQQSV